MTRSLEGCSGHNGLEAEEQMPIEYSDKFSQANACLYTAEPLGSCEPRELGHDMTRCFHTAVHGMLATLSDGLLILVASPDRRRERTTCVPVDLTPLDGGGVRLTADVD